MFQILWWPTKLNALLLHVPNRTHMFCCCFSCLFPTLSCFPGSRFSSLLILTKLGDPHSFFISHMNYLHYNCILMPSSQHLYYLIFKDIDSYIYSNHVKIHTWERVESIHYSLPGYFTQHNISQSQPFSVDFIISLLFVAVCYS